MLAICSLLPTAMAGSLDSLLWRIGSCRQALRTPQRSGGVALLVSHAAGEKRKMPGGGDSVPGSSGLLYPKVRKNRMSMSFPLVKHVHADEDIAPGRPESIWPWASSVCVSTQGWTSVHPSRASRGDNRRAHIPRNAGVVGPRDYETVNIL